MIVWEIINEILIYHNPWELWCGWGRRLYQELFWTLFYLFLLLRRCFKVKRRWALSTVSYFSKSFQNHFSNTHTELFPIPCHGCPILWTLYLAIIVRIRMQAKSERLMGAILKWITIRETSNLFVKQPYDLHTDWRVTLALFPEWTHLAWLCPSAKSTNKLLDSLVFLNVVNLTSITPFTFSYNRLP